MNNKSPHTLAASKPYLPISGHDKLPGMHIFEVEYVSNGWIILSALALSLDIVLKIQLGVSYSVHVRGEDLA